MGNGEIAVFIGKDIPKGHFSFGYDDPDNDDRVLALHNGDDRLASAFLVLGITRSWMKKHPNASLTILINKQDAEEGFWTNGT
jgi:hypothetical protein